jgi:GDP-mannose 4,6 dehydratase
MAPLEEGDIADNGRLRAVLERYDPVALMHFAAHAYVEESVQKPLDYYRDNIVGTAVLLQTLIDFVSCPSSFHPHVPPTARRKGFPSLRTILNDRRIRTDSRS